MDIVYNKARPLVQEALTFRSLRQDLISSNLANVDTPYYKSKDINFEDTMQRRANEVFNKDFSKELHIAKTNQAHLEGFDDGSSKGTVFFRDGHTTRNDGNSVDLDVETTEMSKNSVMFNALISGLKKSGAIFQNVLDSSSKI
jgi:flagellar basal-body rod protein FlgB